MKNRKEKLIILGCSIGLIATLFIGNIKSNALEGKNIKKGVFESVFLLNRETDLINKNILINDITEKKTKKYIYDSVNYNQYNLTEKSNITEEELNVILEDTGLQILTPYYIEAENTYGVNALFLVGLTALESGWGTSDRAIYDNNYTGFGVYTDESIGINSETKRDNILNTAKCLKEEYFTEGGMWFNGYSIREVNEKYCLNEDESPNYNWSEEITEISTDLQHKITLNRECNYENIYNDFLEIVKSQYNLQKW